MQQQTHPLPDVGLADCLMSVAESVSLAEFGDACQTAMQRMTGSATVGLYLLEQEKPDLFFSRHVPDGFLDEYRSGMAQCDPLIETVLGTGRVVDGAGVLGPHEWPRSISFELLHAWGFAWNMCGPLRLETEIVGIFYTATRDPRTPYTDGMLGGMEVLCRAASLALANLVQSGQLQCRGADVPVAGLPIPAGPASLHTMLPPRSAEVAFRVCRGQTNKEIAREMGISDQTVKEHVANLFRRFGAHNRTELATCMLSGMLRQ